MEIGECSPSALCGLAAFPDETVDRFGLRILDVDMEHSGNSLENPPGIDAYILTRNRLVRDSLARMLQKRAGINIVGVSGSADPTEIVGSHCSVILMDSLCSPRDTDLLRDLFKRLPELRVVLFGMDDDSAQFMKAVFLGVGGYLLHDASAAEIIAAVRRVSQGEAACPPKLCMSLIQYVAGQARAMKVATRQDAQFKPLLSRRQLELVDLVARGMTNKEIAANLNLSEFTVKNHIRRIMKQLDAEDRHHAVRMVRAHELPLSN